MERNRQTKVIAIVALFIGVAALTLGFATFSSKLVIEHRARVAVRADSFKVVLSKEQTEEATGTVIPNGKGEKATISNINGPTITNLKANFTNPGEKVEYKFYAVNIGDLDAYLNEIEYANVINTEKIKVCTAGEGTTDEYVQSACNSIRVTVKVADEDTACQTSTFGDHKLEKSHGEKIIVTIEYAKDGVRADGPFSVQFGDIFLNYSTVDTEVKKIPSCTDYETEFNSPFYILGRTNITDNDSDGMISIGDKVTLGTESFYVMSTDLFTGTVTMLSEWNLNVGTNIAEGPAGIQNKSCKGWVISGAYKCTLGFAYNNYWTNPVPSYPLWVYNENSMLYAHIESYVNTLKESGYSTVTGRVIKYEELISLGCRTDGGNSECDSAPEWVSNTTYWTGTAHDDNNIWHLGSDSNLNELSFYNFGENVGVRPVITISAFEI